MQPVVECRRAYSTANPTASPKIEAARMISVKLIDMDFLLPVTEDTGRAALSNHLGRLAKIWRVAAKEA
jgi:hypothetical protein